MTNFAQFFGRSHVVRLDTTFRFNNRIGAISERFVQRNPKQIKKSLKSVKTVDEPSVGVFWSNSFKSPDPSIGQHCPLCA